MCWSGGRWCSQRPLRSCGAGAVERAHRAHPAERCSEGRAPLAVGEPLRRSRGDRRRLDRPVRHPSSPGHSPRHRRRGRPIARRGRTVLQPLRRGGCRQRPDGRAAVAGRALDPLCRYVDFRRRLELAAGELAVRLAQLPADRWRIEPYPLTGERRNTLLIMGETGIFVVSATYAPGHWDDVVAVSRLAGKIQQLLPGYRGQVQSAVCHPFAATSPRIWHRPDEHGEWVGAWLIGGDSVIAWLEHFGPEHGLSAARPGAL